MASLTGRPPRGPSWSLCSLARIVLGAEHLHMARHLLGAEQLRHGTFLARCEHGTILARGEHIARFVPEKVTPPLIRQARFVSEGRSCHRRLRGGFDSPAASKVIHATGDFIPIFMTMLQVRLLVRLLLVALK